MIIKLLSYQSTDTMYMSVPTLTFHTCLPIVCSEVHLYVHCNLFVFSFHKVLEYRVFIWSKPIVIYTPMMSLLSLVCEVCPSLGGFSLTRKESTWKSECTLYIYNACEKKLWPRSLYWKFM